MLQQAQPAIQSLSASDHSVSAPSFSVRSRRSRSEVTTITPPRAEATRLTISSSGEVFFGSEARFHFSLEDVRDHGDPGSRSRTRQRPGRCRTADAAWRDRAPGGPGIGRS